jgi:hypothetical protein
MGSLIAFRRPAKPRAVVGHVVTGFAVVLEAHAGAVLLIADDIELGLTPEQARELGRELLELADDADSRAE